MRRLTMLLLGLAALALAACTTALPVQNGGTTTGIGVDVTGAWARPSAMAMGGEGAGNGAAYMTIRNIGSQPDRLLGASGTVAGAIELHTMTDNNGVMEMRPVDGIDVPVGGQVELRPGSFHIMLIGLTGELKAGDRIPLTLRFQNAGEIDVLAEVRNQ